MSLGIEIENTRVKLVALTAEGHRAAAYPLPYRPGPDRGADFFEGFPAALAAFEAETGLNLRDLPCLVATSHQLGFPTFDRALEVTVALLSRHLPGAALAGVDGLQNPPVTGSGLRFAAARTWGIRTAAMALSDVDLAIDVGSTSTEIVPVRRVAVDPEKDNLERLRDGRLVWIGALETPLDYVAREAAGYTVVPRVGRMAAVTGLLDGHVPALKATFEMEIAQAVGLDPILVGPDIPFIAASFRDQAATRLAKAIRKVITLHLDGACRRVGLMGIGQSSLALPALELLDMSLTVDLEARAGLPPNFGATYGLALAAAGVRPSISGICVVAPRG